MTASHVVPKECEDSTSIKIYWNEKPGKASLSHGVEAKVIARSSLDAALLQLLEQPQSEVSDGEDRQYLMIEEPQEDKEKYRNRCGLLASHYFEQYDILSSFAEISSVSLIGNAQRWALSGVGFNASRSGSPLILGNGHVVGIFVERAGDSSDRKKAVENRAYILPLSSIPDIEINLTKIRNHQKPFDGFMLPLLSLRIQTSSPAKDPAESRADRPINVAYGVSLTIDGFKLDPSLPTFVSRGGQLLEVGSLVDAMLTTAISGGDILRKVTVNQTFTADPGYVFDPATFKVEAASLNPPEARLPAQQCEGKQTNCFRLSDKGSVLSVSFDLYPGVDGRRSWIDGEVRIQLFPSRDLPK
ncbi:serine protease family protein [Agrobacterium vitis]|nr:hypothetical protein [Agrobacterium vitis]NSZ17124.1 hypothetical protein [Agrobacterium vitis]QZO02861.1 serine protease [Agrobacterium vitis]UJL87985.1 hypothetical protein AVF2S5_08650 [Agrobacterium vitis]